MTARDFRLPARKRWGQHFLKSEQTAERIVEAVRLSPEDTVIEVGPGDGALTRPLARRAARLLAIEIDPARAQALAAEFSGGGRVRVLEGDALDRSFSDWLAAAGWSGPSILVGNLPYNAATPILTAAIEEQGTILRAVATVQREVARRFAAGPGQEGYGYLSVRTAAFARGRVLFDLPPGAFRPRPKVVSSVLELSPREHPLDPRRGEAALRLASLGFRSRRKTLANALSGVAPRTEWERRLEALGKDRRARAEELSLEDYLALADRDVS
ncbi:MAG TPA: 16S rRNA (adenine(1518)-N(6)/adenine(1519)-N(6))-dimethyltransferase RsmA [Thermoanaerobaculia bacterium]|jgi:16S rRNA (adenine1518-N6/adenine1519-N6)-dimethyltransferase|nr:16S rRNA (adenine(1518)-N(6)/adenine(1519)-N(6))-dimethyltransferase RsmA [Thermoanaerobaculia bacterium]